MLYFHSMTYRILSLDGGGLRGVISARIMEKLKLKVSDFDLVAGTSAGSINTCAFALGFTPTEVVEFYKSEGKNIFKKNKSLKSRLLLGAKYDIDNLEKVLKKYFGAATIKDAKTKIIVPTFKVNSIDKDSGAKVAQPKVFSSYNKADSCELLYKIACRSSAAPTYFEAYEGYIDGGVYANNPSIEAICAALHEGIPASQIEIVSIGTGISDNCVTPKNWGLLQWAPHIISYIFQGAEESSEFCARAVANKMQPYQIKVPNYGIDSYKDINKMIAEVDKSWT